MRPVVRDAWIAFTEPLEGGIPYLYADIRGLVTIAYGNLVDPLSSALPLPLMHPGGLAATKAEITSAWLAVKGDALAASRGHLYAKRLTTIRLTREGMGALALGKLDANDAVLRQRLPDWEDYPAAVQMALHSLSWACGARFNFPRLISAVKARDFEAAAAEIHMNDRTPEGLLNAGIRPRNLANRILMRNAARVQAFHLDPDELNWKVDVGAAEAITTPQIKNPDSDTFPHADPVYVEELGDDPPRSGNT